MINLKKVILTLLIILFNTSCVNNISSSSTLINSSSIIDYNSYNQYSIELNSMYDINDDYYCVYFYSNTCPACYSLKEYLFSYFDNENKVINLYMVNLFYTNDEDFNKLLIDNSLTDEEIINNSIGAKSIEETYFKHTPSLYFINDSSLVDIYLNYSDVYNFFVNNEIK